MSDPDGEPTRASECTVDCCGASVGQGDASDATDRWLAGPSVLDAALPEDVGARLGRLLGGEPVGTLGEWVADVRAATGGGSIAVEDLCHSAAETGHWGELDGERYHFLCFYDAVVLAALSDRPVDVRTESPGGAVITARAAGTTELSVAPEAAVFSFGVDGSAETPDGGPSPADVYAAVCPYVRAFPHPDAYTEWARGVPAATVAMPLAGATELAAALVG